MSNKNDIGLNFGQKTGIVFAGLLLVAVAVAQSVTFKQLFAQDPGMGQPPPMGDQSGGYQPPMGDQSGNYQPPMGDQSGNYQPPMGDQGSYGTTPSSGMSNCTATGGVWCGTYCKSTPGPCTGTGTGEQPGQMYGVNYAQYRNNPSGCAGVGGIYCTDVQDCFGPGHTCGQGPQQGTQPYGTQTPPATQTQPATGAKACGQSSCSTNSSAPRWCDGVTSTYDPRDCGCARNESCRIGTAGTQPPTTQPVQTIQPTQTTPATQVTPRQTTQPPQTMQQTQTTQPWNQPMPTVQQCGEGKFFCMSLNACSTGPECNAADSARGFQFGAPAWMFQGNIMDSSGQQGQQTMPVQSYFGPQMTGPEQGQEGFAQPDFEDAAKYYQEQGPFKNYDYEQQFNEFQMDFEQPEQNFEVRNESMELQRLSRMGKDLSREVSRMEKELDRATKRSGGLTTCPAIAKASAALSAGKTAVDAIQNVTADTLQQALSAEEQLGMGGGQMGPGGPGGQGFNEDSLWNKVMKAVGQSHMCEGVAQFVKDGQRFLKDIQKEGARVKDEETKAAVTELMTEVQALLADPYSEADFDCAQDEYCDPMRDLGDKMMEYGDQFRTLMEDEFRGREEGNVCGTLEMIKENITNDERVPDDILQEGLSLVNKGLKACEIGDLETGRRVLGKLDMLKAKFEGRGGMPMGEGDEEMGFGMLDAKSMFKDSFVASGDVDIDAFMEQLEEKLLSKMQRAIEAAVNAVTQKFIAQIAELESKLSEALTTKQAAATDNLVFLPEEVAERKADIAEVAVDLDRIVANEEINDGLSAKVKKDYEELLEYATVRNFSDEGADLVLREIQAVETAAAASENVEDAVETLKEEIPEALKAVKAIYESREEKDRQFEGGTMAFKDLHGKEDVWYAGYAAAAKEDGILKGENGNINAERPTNFAEGLTMLARTASGGDVPSDVDMSNSVVARMPEWARPAATFLANEGVPLEEIVGNARSDASMTRLDMMQLAAETFGLEAENANTVNRFRDVGSLGADEKERVAALVEAGVVSGQGDGTRLDPEGELNRAAFAKIMVEIQDAVPAEE